MRVALVDEPAYRENVVTNLILGRGDTRFRGLVSDLEKESLANACCAGWSWKATGLRSRSGQAALNTASGVAGGAGSSDFLCSARDLRRVHSQIAALLYPATTDPQTSTQLRFARTTATTGDAGRRHSPFCG